MKPQHRGLLIVGGVIAGVGALWYWRRGQVQPPMYYGGPVSSKQILTANQPASAPNATQSAIANLQGQIVGPGTMLNSAGEPWTSPYYQNPAYGRSLYPQPSWPTGPGAISHPIDISAGLYG